MKSTEARLLENWMAHSENWSTHAVIAEEDLLATLVKAAENYLARLVKAVENLMAILVKGLEKLLPTVVNRLEWGLALQGSTTPSPFRPGLPGGFSSGERTT